MANELISQWLQTQSNSLRGALAGMVCLEGGLDGSTTVGWPEKAIELSGLQLVNSRVSASGTACIKPINTNVQDEFAAIVGVPMSDHAGGHGVATFLVKGLNPDIGEDALNQLRQAVPALEQQLHPTDASNTLASTRLINAKQKSDAAHQTALATAERLGKLTRLVGTALSADNFHQVAVTLTTELASELGCARVSLGMRRGKVTRLEAVSHTANIKKSQPVAQACVDAMDEAIDQYHAIFLPELDQENLMLSVQNHHALLALEQHPNICTVPLTHEHDGVGALLLEREAGQPFSAQDRELFEHVASFLAPVLLMSYRLGQPWYKRLRLSLARGYKAMSKRDGLLWLIGGSLLIAAVTALTTIPVNHAVSANAQVEGRVQRVISAPQAGYIETVNVRPGDHIEAETILLTLEDEDLLLQIEQSQSELRQLESGYGKALAQRDRTEIAVTQARMAEIKAQIALAQQALTRTHLKAPFAGIILEGDLTQSLGTPVEKGDQLLIIAPDLNVRLSIHVAEEDIRDVYAGQHGRVAFSANPGRQFDFSVQRITPVAKVEDGRNGFTVEAQLDDANGEVRPGYKGLAKLELDPQPLLIRWFSKASEWTQFYIWRWLGEL